MIWYTITTALHTTPPWIIEAEGSEKQQTETGPFWEAMQKILPNLKLFCKAEVGSF